MSYAALIRPHSCAAGAAVALVSLGLLDAVGSLRIALLGSSAVFLMTGAANALNDYFDLEIDRINAPQRPIPSGRVSQAAALRLCAAFLLLSLLAYAALGPAPLLLGLAQAATLGVYDRNSKRLGIFKGPLFAAYCASVAWVPALALGRASAFTWTITACIACGMLTMEIMKDIEDMPGDKALEARTIPLVAGTRAAKRSAEIFAVLTWGFALLPWLLGLVDFRSLLLTSLGLAVGLRPFFGTRGPSAPYFVAALSIGAAGFFWGKS